MTEGHRATLTRGPAVRERACDMTLSEIEEALARAPLFAEVPKRHLRALAKLAKEQTYRTGQRIVREGIAGSALFVLLEGPARVERGGRRLATLGPEEFFGEISLLDGGPRSASVVADAEVRCIKLDGRDLRALLEREPTVVLRLLAALAARLRRHEGPPVG